ncbi:receptor activity-modifying protein 1-like isoform X1 [Myxocyprinus asiaticus]|uniref:receptor activity-modifying protein 1-like isoform X1 n=1 Tax=Myxocyprinus asiaticus TaxID=70543 RepID=UPI0022215F68|nr:receptor activity-modifying protein 1-like isoform X1 [Myxocyprinus asiaticus]
MTMANICYKPASKLVGTILFWVCLCLLVTTLQTLVPNGQKHTVRQTVSTPPTEVHSTTYIRADLGHGERKTFDCANKTICNMYCSFCVSNDWTPQGCYETLVSLCKINFDNAMESINSTNWCSLERVKSAYNNFTVCTESIADCLLLPWPNNFVERTFVDIHSKYFLECPTEGLRDPPPSIVLALVMTPICLIPVMVILVVLKTKNGDRRS